MNEHKPFSEHWWWQKLLDHVYYCKCKYYDVEEMKRDSELTGFIINRIQIAHIRELRQEISDLHCNHGSRYSLAVDTVLAIIDGRNNKQIICEDIE